MTEPRNAATPAPMEGHGFAGLSIEHLEVFNGDDQIWSEFENHRDARAFGAQWAAFARASVFPTLAAQLDGGGSDPRTGRFFEEMEAGMAARLRPRPRNG